MRKRKSHRPALSLDYLSAHMGGLANDRRRLNEIQAAYDNLSLIGQLLCSGTDITRMREDFNRLASTLLEQLAREHHKKAVLNLGSAARVSIDILTRNLFERTADIGFLATDDDIQAFAEAVAHEPAVRDDPSWQYRLHARFNEYVAKYSVYHNIILLSPSGEVLIQLDGNNPVTHTQDRLLGEALTTSAPYVEVFRPTDLIPGEASPLVYAYRVMSSDGTQPVGVLCLCFRFQDECRRIFDSLVAEDDWSVLTLLDADQRVIASSDPNQFPLGVRLEAVHDESCRVVRFAGREYLATTRAAQGYQGYAGPGWVGHALAPLNHAFEMSEARELEAVADDVLAGVLETASLFSPELKAIPQNAATIQSELNRAVWNGYVWLVRDPAAAQNAAFAKVLLREIGSTGVRTRNVFSESITNLYKTVVSSVLFDCATQAAQAIDIMDRNLYERANDCRWWALTRSFRTALSAPGAPDSSQRARLTDILRRINGLYTVYSNLILFDRHGKVVAVSNPGYGDWVGQTLGEGWVRSALGLADTGSYCVSDFAPSGLYAGQPTYIYAATVREPEGNEPVGGIAIVFDAAPQFRAMLDDVLPRQSDGSAVPGAFAVFAERDGRVIASTRTDLPAGTPLMIGYEFFNLAHGDNCTNIVIFDGRYYAVGSSMSAGYREYKGEEDRYRNDIVALVFSPLSEHVIDASELAHRSERLSNTYTSRLGGSGERLDIACFHIGRNWYGIRSAQVVEAIDAERLTPMPGLPEHFAGCVMHEGQAITVLDLAHKLTPQRAGQERRQHRPGTARPQIIVLHSPQHQLRFGIRVDQVDAVCEVPVADIEPLPDMMNDGKSVIESLVRPQPDSGERRILIVLSVDRIIERLSPHGDLGNTAWLPAMLGNKMA